MNAACQATTEKQKIEQQKKIRTPAAMQHVLLAKFTMPCLAAIASVATKLPDQASKLA